MPCQLLVPARIVAIAMARQAFEAPEGDDAGRAAMLADQLLVTKHVASALEEKGGRRLTALRTDKGEMSCAPTLNEMSEPVHVFPVRDAVDAAFPLTRSQSRRTQKWKSVTPTHSLRMVTVPTSRAKRVPQLHARELRNSPTMNRVPDLIAAPASRVPRA